MSLSSSLSLVSSSLSLSSISLAISRLLLFATFASLISVIHFHYAKSYSMLSMASFSFLLSASSRIFFMCCAHSSIVMFARSLFVAHRLRAAIFVTSVIFSTSSMTFMSRISFLGVFIISIYYMSFRIVLSLDTMTQMALCSLDFACTSPICGYFARCLGF